ELRALGPANFLYADGDALFAHGHRRMQLASGRAEPPGLWLMQREFAAVPAGVDDLVAVTVERAARSAVWLASVPLSDEAWRPLAEGELLVVRAGHIVADARP
ncbi:MAG: class II glutamine amidotransferase, partial [Rubrivivax sp.]|nr:class II glutamine amidotransferase [Rubrivivax sp.]